MAMKRIGYALFVVLPASPAFAHVGHGEGFPAGFIHPMTGMDHVLAMLAVGLWAAMRGGRAILLWPLAFVLAMLGGFALAQAGFVIPRLEPMILSSVIALGAVIALGLNAPLLLGGGAVALAGLAHGFAHGTEVQGALLPFAGGFAVSTLLLHAGGLGVGLAAERLAVRRPLRLMGFGIMATGAALAFA
jgi:urease accessory protein